MKDLRRLVSTWLYNGISIFFSIFGIKRAVKEDILVKIINLKKKRLYRAALCVTEQNYKYSDLILFYHLFFLLKLGKRLRFMEIFTKNPSARAIKLFQFYCRTLPNWRREILVKKMYNRNRNSQVFVYIYSEHLYRSNKSLEAMKIIKDFVKDKKIFMTDIYCTYLINLLALKIEKALHGTLDFSYEYIESIESYRRYIGSRGRI